MKLVCVDAGSADDAVIAAALDRAVALADGADRLLLFGRVSDVAARRHREHRERRDGAWLDDAAAWLLQGDGDEPPPPRPREDTLDTRAVAILPPGRGPLGLHTTDRLLELAGSLVVMAVPGDDGVDAFDNAHLWIIGGAAFSVDARAGRAAVRVGDRIVVVRVAGNDASVEAWSLGGEDVTRHAFSLAPSNKLSVRGGASP